jgi:hypothetical protein
MKMENIRGLAFYFSTRNPVLEKKREGKKKKKKKTNRDRITGMKPLEIPYIPLL